MNFKKTELRSYSPDEAGHLFGLGHENKRRLAASFFSWFEKYILALVISGFIAGIGVARSAQ